jgi:hypothetical protein
VCIDKFHSAQNDLPEELKHLKLYTSMFPELHQNLVNSFSEYAKCVICESLVLVIPFVLMMVVSAPAEIRKRRDAAKDTSELGHESSSAEAEDAVAPSTSDGWEWAAQDFGELLELDITNDDNHSPLPTRKPKQEAADPDHALKLKLIPPPSRTKPVKRELPVKVPDAKWRFISQGRNPNGALLTPNPDADERTLAEGISPTTKAIGDAEALTEDDSLDDAQAIVDAEVLANTRARALAEAKAIADAKALAEAKAIADAKALAEAKATAAAKALAEAKAIADAKALAEAKATAAAKALAEAKAIADAKALAEANDHS